MFTGIVEALGTVIHLQKEGTNLEITVESHISAELKADQSVSHNGCCLTVTRTRGNTHTVTAVQETLRKSTLAEIKIRDLINLERSMLNNGRFDGHIVQGHVDQVAVCKSRTDENGSWVYVFEYDAGVGNFTVEKGSICVDGTSLTCFNSDPGRFSVAIIPFTFEHTNFKNINHGDSVNLEFDILGKYVRKLMTMPEFQTRK